MSTAPIRQPDHPVTPLFVERWSPRAFAAEAIDEATLFTLFEAARWAPSAFNAQPWRFLYGRAGTPAFATLLDGLLPLNQTWARHAAALVLLLSARQWTPPGQSAPQPLATHAFDAGAAWASLALQAQLLGWRTHAMAGIDRDRLRSALAVPEDFAIEVALAIGRPGDKAQLPEALQAREQPSPRLPLSALAAEGRFAFGA